jgi:ADP-ribosylglycohydrolase
MLERESKIWGVVYGTAVGDAVGYPLEFRSRESLWAEFGRPVTWYTRLVGGVAQFSDDTQMFRAVAEGILDAWDVPEIRKTASAELLAPHVSARIAAWGRSPENNRAPGGACMLGAGNLAAGLPWRQAGKVNGGGCGAAMRSQAYGLFFPWWTAAEVAGEHALMTHRSPPGQASAAAVAAIIASLVTAPSYLGETALFHAAERGITAAERYHHYTADMLREAVAAAQAALRSHSGLGPIAAEVLDRWRGWAGHEAVAAALFCLLISHGDFLETLAWACNTSGDSDSLGAIACAFAGAYRGFAAVPEHLREQIEDRAGLARLAKSIELHQ